MSTTPHEGLPQSPQRPDALSSADSWPAVFPETSGQGQAEAPASTSLHRDESYDAGGSDDMIGRTLEEAAKHSREQTSRRAVEAAHAATQNPTSSTSAPEVETQTQVMRPIPPKMPGKLKRLWGTVKRIGHRTPTNSSDFPNPSEEDPGNFQEMFAAASQVHSGTEYAGAKIEPEASGGDFDAISSTAAPNDQELVELSMSRVESEPSHADANEDENISHEAEEAQLREEVRRIRAILEHTESVTLQSILGHLQQQGVTLDQQNQILAAVFGGRRDYINVSASAQTSGSLVPREDEPLVLGRLNLEDLSQTVDYPELARSEMLDRQNNMWRIQAFSALLNYAQQTAHVLSRNPANLSRMITMKIVCEEESKYTPPHSRAPAIVNTLVTNDTQKNNRLLWRQQKGFSPYGGDLKVVTEDVKVWIINGWEETIPNPNLPIYQPELSHASLQESKRVRHPSTPNNPYTDPATKPAKNGWAFDENGNIYQFLYGGNLIPITSFERAVAVSGQTMPGTKETRVDNGRADFQRLDASWANDFARVIAELRR